jgi:hypothetical protein
MLRKAWCPMLRYHCTHSSRLTAPRVWFSSHCVCRPRPRPRRCSRGNATPPGNRSLALRPSRPKERKKQRCTKTAQKPDALQKLLLVLPSRRWWPPSSSGYRQRQVAPLKGSMPPPPPMLRWRDHNLRFWNLLLEYYARATSTSVQIVVTWVMVVEYHPA